MTERLEHGLERDEILEMVPALADRDPESAYLFYDCQTDDSRLVLTILQEAERFGAVCLNHLGVTELRERDGRADGVEVLDRYQIGYWCPCSRERFEAVLITLGAEELTRIIEEEDDEATELVCHFCNTAYHFTPRDMEDILRAVPDDLLLDTPGKVEFETADDARVRYIDYLTTRLEAPRPFVEEASHARELARREPPRQLKARR